MIKQAYAGLPDASDGGQAYVDAMKELEDSASFKAAVAEHERAIRRRVQSQNALDDAVRAVRSTVDDEAAATALDQLQNAVETARKATEATAYWSGTRRASSIEEFVQLSLQALTALHRAHSIALMEICTDR